MTHNNVEAGSSVRSIGRSPPVATTRLDSIVLRMYPAGFQTGKSGCASPLVLVQRIIRVCSPGDGKVNCVCHCRKPYLPSSFPSWVGCQLLPLSIDRSTRATAESPPKAMPRACAGVSTGTVSPERMLVMNDLGEFRVTGTSLNPV